MQQIKQYLQGGDPSLLGNVEKYFLEVNRKRIFQNLSRINFQNLYKIIKFAIEL